jgi:hypothetical protein
MLPKNTLKAFHHMGIRYSFKLPWKYAKCEVPEVINYPQEAMGILYREMRVRMPFGPNQRYCFYTDQHEDDVLERDRLPNAIIAYQLADDAEVYFCVLDSNDNLVTYNGDTVYGVIHFDVEQNLPLLTVQKSEELEGIEHFPEEIEKELKLAATIITTTMFLMNYPRIKEAGQSPAFRKAPIQKKKRPKDYVIQIARNKYIHDDPYEDNIFVKLTKRMKAPHMRRGTWCVSSRTGKTWWRRGAAVHDGVTTTDYRL